MVFDRQAGNNIAERALRGVALGRKDWLHLGSADGGHSDAIVYTLVATAKLAGIEPHAYPRYLLGRIGDHAINGVDELVPRNMQAVTNSNLTDQLWRLERGRQTCKANMAAKRKSINLIPGQINLEAQIENRDQITVGYMTLFECVAVANDEHNTVASLVRRPNESVPDLLERLDMAIEAPYEYDQIIDEVNPPR